MAVEVGTAAVVAQGGAGSAWASGHLDVAEVDAGVEHRAGVGVAEPVARRPGPCGLTLVTVAVGIAATLQSVAFALIPVAGLERGDDLSTKVGVYVAILGAAVCAVGAGLREGDRGRRRRPPGQRDPRL